ncbi:receptor-like cytoplasmic kinase 176 [Physcomitrium patens]|uniref:Protein kinase domain-containing protein n=1 Tax=Physcomitrium patens TaxID=3218 RepID=A0A2K1IQ86_PHYPA|nr:proline-rich receptor-like protein kinase PERK2 [Physcomitrium patens]PNR31444.1 hypothetical protein PHYPA_025565 [Physcomitrium patens]|eukprot:XP_024358884.1 proline-rich receptor-like protein kinase PERK2 [Physcomitrella patens]
MMRSCLSSQTLKKDVVDSLRPSRRRRIATASPNPEKRKAFQQIFGGQPLPLPKPEPCVGSELLLAGHGNLSSSFFHISNFSQFDEDDSQIICTRKSRIPLRFPPPPASSPSSSGKCSPSARLVPGDCKEVPVQEHPSPAQGDPAPPPPWSSSSSLSLNDSSSSSSPPWCSSPMTTPQLPSQPPALETTPLLQAAALPCSKITTSDGIEASTPSSSLIPTPPSLNKTCGGGSAASEVLEVATYIGNDVKAFGFDEINRACSEGSSERGVVIVGDVSIITTWIGKDDAARRKLVAVVCKHRNSHQEWKDWAAKVNLLSRVDDHHICKLQGYCGSEAEQILVYEHVCGGSLSDYLFGSLCKALLGWKSRVRIALGAARALAYIHDLAPIEVVYKDFKSSSVLLDLDFSVKLAGQGLDVIAWREDKLNKAASKVLRKSEASAKRNIRSFGVFLLELLTGKSIAGERFLNDEKLYTQWAKPYLRADLEQLSTIIDAHIRRQYPCPGLKRVAALTLQCLSKDPIKRPSISDVVEVLDNTMILQPACKAVRNSDMNKCM